MRRGQVALPVALILILALALAGCVRTSGFASRSGAPDTRAPSVDGDAGLDLRIDADRGTSDDLFHDAHAKETGPCPPGCKTCDGGVCRYSCTGATSPCVCPPGLECVVSCSQEDTCSQPIICGAERCNVRCKGGNTCQAAIDCSKSKDCVIDCSGDPACLGPITCGPGRCSVGCSGQGSCAGLVDCSASCACKVNCADVQACGAGVSCPAACAKCGQNDSCDSCP